MGSVISSVTHFRTTVPGIGVLLLAAGHWWSTGAFSPSDFMDILTGFGLVAVQGPAKA